MVFQNTLRLALFCVFALGFPSVTYAAEYYEGAINRPASSGQHRSGYIEDDSGQIKNAIKVGLMSSRSYNVYLPRGKSENAPYKRPAIVLLHGAGRTGASLVERWRSIADREDVILLGPHANGGWNPAIDGQKFLPAMLEDAIKKYNIDTKRIYVFGHSMGGIFAATLAITQPNGFAAIGIHAGLLPDSAFSALSAEGRKTPIVIINGTHDQGFPLPKVQATAKAFNQAGHDVNFYILKGHGHWYYDIAPDINDMAWDYFSGKKLD